MITDPPAYPMACAACPHTRISPAAIVIETRLNSFIAVPPQKTCAAGTASGGPSAAALKGSKSSHLQFCTPAASFAGVDKKFRTGTSCRSTCADLRIRWLRFEHYRCADCSSERQAFRDADQANNAR